MKLSLTCVPLFFLQFTLLFVSDTLAASQPGEFSFAINYGIADARQNDDVESDGTLSLAFEYQKARYASLRGSAGFMAFDSSGGSSMNGSTSADSLYLLGNIVITPRFAVVQPYVTAGVGIYRIEAKAPSGSSKEVELGANFGVGLDLQLLRSFALRGELVFHYITGDITSPIETITLGGRFDF